MTGQRLGEQGWGGEAAGEAVCEEDAGEVEDSGQPGGGEVEGDDAAGQSEHEGPQRIDGGGVREGCEAGVEQRDIGDEAVAVADVGGDIIVVGRVGAVVGLMGGVDQLEGEEAEEQRGEQEALEQEPGGSPGEGAEEVLVGGHGAPARAAAMASRAGARRLKDSWQGRAKRRSERRAPVGRWLLMHLRWMPRASRAA